MTLVLFSTFLPFYKGDWSSPKNFLKKREIIILLVLSLFQSNKYGGLEVQNILTNQKTQQQI